MRRATPMTEDDLWVKASRIAAIAYPEPPRRGKPSDHLPADDPLAYWLLTEAIATLAMRYAGDLALPAAAEPQP